MTKENMNFEPENDELESDPYNFQEAIKEFEQNDHLKKIAHNLDRIATALEKLTKPKPTSTNQSKKELIRNTDTSNHEYEP